jgi:hypothetical protein
MRKTTAYLSDEDVEALRKLSAATGRSHDLRQIRALVPVPP